MHDRPIQMSVERGPARGLLGAPAAVRYAAAAGLTLVAFVLKQELAFYLQPTFILFYPAVMIAAVFGGLGPGLVATTLSAVLSALWVIPSRRGPGPLDLPDAVSLAAFTAICALISLVSAIARRRTQQLARYEREREFLQRLAAERERLDVTLRSIGDAVIATDPAARITIMNGVAEALTGWSALDALGRPLHEVFRIFKEGTREAVEDPVTRVLREGVVVGLANSTVLVARDGTEVPIADSGAPIRDPGGAIHGVVLVFRDQTAERRADQSRREAEARLGQSEELYRTLFQLNPSGVILLDEGGAITAFNDKACQQLGYDREQFAHLHLHDIDPDEPEPGLVHAHLMRIAERGADEFEAVQRTRSGELRNVLVSVRPVQVASKRRFLAVWQDVTERRTLEQQLRQAQKLESVGRLAGGVAHDFNNMLTVILSCADALNGSPLHDPDALENVQEIAAAGGRARDLTRQLLAFARKQVIAPVPIDLNVQVRSLQRMLGRLLGEDVELQVALDPDLWTAHADPSQIEQVLINLAVNARDAMPSGGRLSIATRNRTVTDEDALAGEGLRPGSWVQLTIDDTGGGLTPEAQTHLFEPFFTTKAPGKGTGLGLATVYGIVTQSGGHIRVASEAGRGTSFEISLPRLKEAPVAALASPRKPASTAGTEQVLVVEDDPQVRGVIVRMLASGGYRVHAAAHPQEALDLGPERLAPLHLLVTDVVMPGMDGHALATQLTSRHPRLKVLYLSGYSDEVISQRGVLDSGIQFLAKPFTRSTLLGKVRAVLDAG